MNKVSWGDCPNGCGEDNIIHHSDGSVETCMHCNGYAVYEQEQILKRKPFSAWDYTEQQFAPVIEMDLWRHLCEEYGRLLTVDEQLAEAERIRKAKEQVKGPDDAA